tara:strand:+ start:389 stop:1066 length:678 start_codon:yes stop_codon:yes gene_type:complete
MSKLWIFGDSFVSPLNKNYDKDYYPDWTWTKQLAYKLQSDLKIAALPGISNQWISKEVTKHYDQMQPGDFVVVVTTQQNRTWLIKDHPEFSNIFANSHHFDKFLTKKQCSAVNSYIEQFAEQHDFISNIHYEWFLSWIRTKLSSKVMLCLLPGFGTTTSHDITGKICLSVVEKNEFAQLQDKPMFDKRINHLSEHNHKILADKVYKFFKENEKIDLSTEFISKTI